MGCINSSRILLDSAIRERKLPMRSCIERLEAEKEKNLEVKVTSLKAKSAVVGDGQNGIQDLKQKIDALMTVVQSATLRGAWLKLNGNGMTPQKERE